MLWCARTERGPSMYEMEGPRLPEPPSPPIARWPLATRHHRCQNPAVRASRPALSAFPGLPRGRIPSSVVRDFYCLGGASHKAFSQTLQDSFAVHRTSVVYPLCMTGFHRAIHSCIHRLGETSPGSRAVRDPARLQPHFPLLMRPRRPDAGPRRAMTPTMPHKGRPLR
jgi:hypothetical protein